MSLYPSTWQMTFVDGLTGAPVAGASYPALRSALDVEVVAWRGDTAYAVVRYSNGRTDGRGDRVQLVRLVPGALEAQPVLTAPDGTLAMNVATDHVDARRPAGPPENGVNVAEVLGWTLTAAACLAPFVTPPLVLVFLLWKHRRRRLRLLRRQGRRGALGQFQ